METEEERCAKARKHQRIADAFERGDLDALRAAVGDAAAIPAGPMPDTIGSCLVFAIYHSPLAFIRTLLDIGADPNAPAGDGFPPLIAALSCARAAAGARPRDDVADLLRLLLAHGADPDARGINDYTPLHMAVAERQALAVQILLDAGADPDLRTRIDDCMTPLEMAQSAGLADIEEILARKGQPLSRRLRGGLTLLWDIPGGGELVRRQHTYRIRFRLWLEDGGPVRWRRAWGPTAACRLEDDGATLIAVVRIDRQSLINGLFYGLAGMRVGGTRRLRMAPHLGYGDAGVPDVIPPHAVLIAETTVMERTGQF